MDTNGVMTDYAAVDTFTVDWTTLC